jgi:hypothetical protein
MCPFIEQSPHSIGQPLAPLPTIPLAGSYPVTQGRPPLQALISAWLATLQQIPRAQQQQLQVSVYGMGPSKLVEDTKLLCDSVNSSSRGKVFLGFVQKTHEL